MLFSANSLAASADTTGRNGPAEQPAAISAGPSRRSAPSRRWTWRLPLPRPPGRPHRPARPEPRPRRRRHLRQDPRRPHRQAHRPLPRPDAGPRRLRHLGSLDYGVAFFPQDADNSLQSDENWLEKAMGWWHGRSCLKTALSLQRMTQKRGSVIMAKKTAKSRSPEPIAAQPANGHPQTIDLDLLDFDPENPRTVERLGHQASQTQIQDFLLGNEMNARDLVPSFMTNGYIPYEPLIVKEGKRGRFTVAEGNRRLAALRSMKTAADEEVTRAFEHHNLNEVPCLIFTGDERQLLAYLGLRHLSKTKDWTTAAKGAFVERVLRTSAETEPAGRLREAGRLTNTSTSALRLILLTRRLFDAANNLGFALPTTGADSDTTFWHLGDAVRRSHTKAYLRLVEDPDPLNIPRFDEGRFEKLVGWLYGNPKTKTTPLIGSIRDIPDLNNCLGDPRAIRALESGSNLKEALEELEAAGANVAGHLDRAKRAIQRATSGLSDVDPEGLEQVRVGRDELKRAIEQFEAGLAAAEQPRAGRDR